MILLSLSSYVNLFIMQSKGIILMFDRKKEAGDISQRANGACAARSLFMISLNEQQVLPGIVSDNLFTLSDRK